MEVLYRRATLADVPRMAELETLCFADPWSEDALRSELSGLNKVVYVAAEVDGVVVGYAGIWVILDEGHITNVAVHPDYRRHGIGREIVSRLLAFSEEEGVEQQTLEVRPSNSGAIALYEGFGFQLAGRRKGYYADNHEDALIYWRQAKK